MASPANAPVRTLAPPQPSLSAPASAPTTPPRQTSSSHSNISPASSPASDALAESLRAHSLRLRRATVFAEFEHALITLLTIYIIYTYYIDHMLLVLIIRASQVIRLLYFPYATAAAQHGAALLLLLSNLPILFLHHVNFFYSKERQVGDMLFINFIGPEPRGFAKIVIVDSIIITLEAFLLQCKWPSLAPRLLSVLPLPASEQLPLQQTNSHNDMESDQLTNSTQDPNSHQSTTANDNRCPNDTNSTTVTLNEHATRIDVGTAVENNPSASTTTNQ